MKTNKALFGAQCMKCDFSLPPMLKEQQAAMMEAHIQDRHPEELDSYRKRVQHPPTLEESL